MEDGRSRRHAERTRNLREEIDPHIHLKERYSAFNPLLKACGHFLRIGRPVRVRIDPYPVPELPSEQLIYGHSICLPRYIPQSHLHRANASRLPPMVAKLLDLAEESVHVAGILAQQA